jgi:hypothetical protein
MKSPYLIALIWFVVFAAVPAIAAAMGHNLNAWFIGWLAIDAVSAVVVANTIEAARQS